MPPPPRVVRIDIVHPDQDELLGALTFSSQ
jgi:hypothetical protein